MDERERRKERSAPPMPSCGIDNVVDVWSAVPQRLPPLQLTYHPPLWRAPNSQELPVNVPMSMVTSGENNNPRKKRTRSKTNRRREQCRINQARYRERKRADEQSLDQTVQSLRQQIVELEQRRLALRWAVNTRDAAAKIQIEFFRLFQYGMNTNERQAKHATYVMPTQEKQVAFLRATSSPTLRIDNLYGLEHYIQQNLRFSNYYDDMYLQLDHIEPVFGPDDGVRLCATLKMDLTVTTSTIRHVFPHLWHESAIRTKLEGQRIHCHAIIHYEFNHHTQLVGVDWTVDFVSALLGILTIEEVALTLGGAQIARDAYLTGG